MNEAENNKRIAKNTALLYIRMFFIMAIQLYTSRVVLNTLGVVDYGLYNVVGGIVTMFAFLNGAMMTSTQRYITYELGRDNKRRLAEVFTTCFHIHLIVSIIIIVLGETVGLWFLYEKMVIPENRFVAAFWVYQISIFTMCIQVMSVPYNSDIVAHEQMGIFAFISVIEVILKLAVVYMLLIGDFDKLILYAILVAIVQLSIQLLYKLYCNRHFVESNLIKFLDKKLVFEMGSFMGWNIFGNLANTLFDTGLNLLLNMFFGPVVNAARAIAVQVEAAIAQFSSNFLMAVAPQITKLYAKENYNELHSLIYWSSKFAFFLMLALSLPIMLEADVILTLWLKIVPENTVVFVNILLLIVIIDSVARPLMTAAAATGNVKLYQSVIGGILLSIVPIAYVVLKSGGGPSSVYIVHLTICTIAFLTRLLIVRPMIKLPLVEYFSNVILPSLLVLMISVPICLLISRYLDHDIYEMAIVCVLSFLTVLLAAYMVGLNHIERALVNSKVKSFTNRICRISNGHNK